MRLLSNVSSIVESLKTASDKLEKKGNVIGKSITYLKNVYTDYKEVAVQVKSDIREKPLKASLFLTGMGFVYYSITHNPNEQSFRAKFIQCANDASTVSPQLVKPSAVEHLQYIQRSYNKDLIRHTSFGLFSVIWVDKYSDQCAMFETNCSYLQLPYSKIVSQVIDVGFWNIWWVISRKMLDYDINY